MCSNPLSCVFIPMLSASLKSISRECWEVKGRVPELFSYRTISEDDYNIKHGSPPCCVLICSPKSWERSLQI